MSVRSLEERPKLGRLFAKAAVTARGRRGENLPDATYEFSDVAIDRQNLASYAEVCGFRQSNALPATYPHLLGFPAAVLLMVDPSFPFPLPGLVHVRNRIEQQRALHADEHFAIRVHAADLRPHPRGRQFDMMTEVSVGGEPVWTETSTYLRRVRSSRPAPPPVEGQRQGRTPTAIWRVPGNIGRRYAAVSGDVNPIHLNPLAARLFGFPRTIAHGMWVKARCLAALEGRLPDGLIADVEFKSPLLLPSTVGFSAKSDVTSWTMSVTHLSSGRPHLLGQVTASPKG